MQGTNKPLLSGTKREKTATRASSLLSLVLHVKMALINCTYYVEKSKIEESNVGTSKEQPLTISSDVDSHGPLVTAMEGVIGVCCDNELTGSKIMFFFQIFTVKYCPMVGNELLSSVIAVGQVGAWRIVHFAAFSDNDQVYNDISGDETFQPESHFFTILEISKGKCT